jgi:biopolymer transport protein ExbD
MDTGSAAGGTVRHEINVTPLVDVVLVLLIIFMVAMPIMQLGYRVVTPKPGGPGPPGSQLPPESQLIVRLDRDGHVYLNRLEVPRSLFAQRLREVTANRAGAPVLFAADGELPYGQVADFMDVVRHNGGRNLGIVFDDLKPAG